MNFLTRRCGRNVFRIHPGLPFSTGPAVPDDPGNDLPLRGGHEISISGIEYAHGREGTGVHAVLMQGVVSDRVDLQMIKKNAHHIIGGVPELCRTDPAYSAVIHLCTHGGAELLIDCIELRGLLQAAVYSGSKAAKALVQAMDSIQKRRAQCHYQGDDK